MNNIVYRKATAEDCYSIAELKGIVWNTTYKGIYPDEKLTGYDVRKNEQILQNIVNNPDIEIYVATDNDRIIGFMTCGKPYKPFRHYDQEVGYDKFMVAVNSRNINAIQFYLAMGGKIVLSEEKQLKIEFVL